jgi:hypothetical protein
MSGHYACGAACRSLDSKAVNGHRDEIFQVPLTSRPVLHTVACLLSLLSPVHLHPLACPTVVPGLRAVKKAYERMNARHDESRVFTSEGRSSTTRQFCHKTRGYHDPTNLVNIRMAFPPRKLLLVHSSHFIPIPSGCRALKRGITCRFLR